MARTLSDTHPLATLTMSDHFLVETQLKLVGGWRSAGKQKGVKRVLKVSELNNSVKERKY